MTQKFRKYAIFLMLPVHLAVFWVLNESGTALLITALLATLADLALSIWQLRLLTRREAAVRPFLHDFGFYFTQVILLIAAEFAISRVIKAPGGDFNMLGSYFSQNLWLAVCIAMLLTAALICLAVGAARTMLFHDDKK